MPQDSSPRKLEVASTLTDLRNNDSNTNPIPNSKNKLEQKLHSNSQQDSSHLQRDSSHPQLDSSQQDYGEVNNPEIKKTSAQEINEEIDLKKNRNRVITGVLVASSLGGATLLGLMAFKVINVSSFILFPGYGASEVVLGLVGIYAFSQVSLAFTSKSGISKVEEKKPRVFDGVNPSVEQDIHNQKLRDKTKEKNQEELQGRSYNKTSNWKDKLESERREKSQRGL